MPATLSSPRRKTAIAAVLAPVRVKLGNSGEGGAVRKAVWNSAPNRADDGYSTPGVISMRTLGSSVVLLSILSLGAAAMAGGPQQIPGPTCGDYYGDGGDMCGDPCCGHCHHRLFGHGDRWAESGFNCGCNGSYKFPVPPLYTYHWPGMYQATLMTDYHSPWRFPPLKPYVDESRLEFIGRASRTPRVQPASATTLIPTPSRPVSFSQRLEESQR
jgi:hypothetical protein